MKIRNGFVSNSSSSSFIIIGKTVKLPDKFRKGIICKGDYLCEGYDIFDLTEDIYYKLLERSNYDIELFEGKSYNTEYDDYVEVDSKNLPVGKFKIIALEKDYHGTEDFNDFVDRYVKE